MGPSACLLWLLFAAAPAAGPVPTGQSGQSGDLVVNLYNQARLDVYAPDGTLKVTTAGNGTGTQWIGATILPGGRFATSRRSPARGINVFDASGTEIATFDTPEVSSTGDLSVFSDGTLALVDYISSQIEYYTPAGTHIVTVSEPGFSIPWGTYIDADDVLWVGANPDVWRFDRSGNLLERIPTGFRVGDVVPLPDGTFWALDQQGGRCVYYDASGTELSSFATGLGGSGNPHYGLAVASDLSLYVGVWGHPFVPHFAPDGTPLGTQPVGSGDVVFVSVTGSLPSGAVPYCTAKPNSLGCTPEIRSSGFPRASQDSGFTVSAANVRNAKPGLLLYTLSGRTAAPFQGGVLCLAAPVQRTPAVGSGGPPPPIQNCGGGWRMDMNAFAAGLAGGSPHPGLRVPGTFVHCQWWGRDPGDAFGSALTDALQYEITP